MVRVLIETSPWQEDGRCEKKLGRNEKVGGGMWSSYTGNILLHVGFSNPVSSSNVVHFIGNDSFYMIGVVVLQFVGLCIIMTMSSLSFFWYFIFACFF